MKHTDIKILFEKGQDFANGSVTVCDWVRTWRDSKSIAFIELNDGTTVKNLQLVIEKDKLDESTVKPALMVGCALQVVGKFIVSERNGYELSVENTPCSAVVRRIIPYRKNTIRLNF